MKTSCEINFHQKFSIFQLLVASKSLSMYKNIPRNLQPHGLTIVIKLRLMGRREITQSGIDCPRCSLKGLYRRNLTEPLTPQIQDDPKPISTFHWGRKDRNFMCLRQRGNGQQRNDHWTVDCGQLFQRAMTGEHKHLF